MNAALRQTPIVIAGGGLAGLSLAIGLQSRGVAVEVHEAMCYPRHRVCGEFISGVSASTIAALGMSEIMSQTLRHQQATWWSGDKQIATFSLPQAAYAVSRYRLDQQLCQQLRDMGGKVIESSRLAPELREGMVWAAGRRPTKGTWLGMKMHVKGMALQTSLEMHLGDHGYVGLSQVEDGWINVCGLFQLRPEAKAPREQLFADYLQRCGLGALADRLSAAELREGSFSAVAGFRLGRQVAAHSGVAIGDAESIIPPFTGNGMSMALQAAEAAIEPLLRYASGQSTWHDCATALRSQQQRLFRRRLVVAQWFHRALLMPQFRSSLEILAAGQLLPMRALFTLTR